MTFRLALVLLLGAALGACQKAADQPPPATAQAGPSVVRPGAPGQASQASGTQVTPPTYTADDVEFMQGMIHHHAQAIEMSALIPARSTNAALRQLGQKITISQGDEIKMMQRWLRDRGKDAPDPNTHMMPDGSMMGPMGPMMPGMLSAGEMTQLAAARGAAFDKLYLTGMIKHHGGALTMVKDLFSHAGAAQESDIFQFASDIQVDQQTEIHRMQQMLAAMH
jgi:uncharacterized protein (DUF305 family)